MLLSTAALDFQAISQSEVKIDLLNGHETLDKMSFRATLGSEKARYFNNGSRTAQPENTCDFPSARLTWHSEYRLRGEGLGLSTQELESEASLAACRERPLRMPLGAWFPEVCESRQATSRNLSTSHRHFCRNQDAGQIQQHKGYAR